MSDSPASRAQPHCPQFSDFTRMWACAGRELWYNRGIACRIVASRFGVAKERRSMILPFTLPSILPPTFDLTFFASAGWHLAD